MNKIIPTTYIDGISQIYLTGNTIRLDLMTLQPHLKSESGQAVYETTQRIVLPLEGFVEAFNLQEELIKNLMDNNVVQRNLSSLPQEKSQKVSKQREE